MTASAWRGVASLLWLTGSTLSSQVIEFDSGGLHYVTLSRNGVTVMYALLPVPVREYAVIQVAVSNGSTKTWNIRPEDFRFQRPDGVSITPTPARAVVTEFIDHGGRSDVVKLVNAYEMGLYGMKHLPSTNGYEARREAALAAVNSARLKAAAAASAIVLVATPLKAGDSTDGAIFYPNAGKPLGPGKLIAAVAGTVFEFENSPLPSPNTQ